MSSTTSCTPTWLRFLTRTNRSSGSKIPSPTSTSQDWPDRTSSVKSGWVPAQPLLLPYLLPTLTLSQSRPAWARMIPLALNNSSALCHHAGSNQDRLSISGDFWLLSSTLVTCSSPTLSLQVNRVLSKKRLPFVIQTSSISLPTSSVFPAVRALSLL